MLQSTEGINNTQTVLWPTFHENLGKPDENYKCIIFKTLMQKITPNDSIKILMCHFLSCTHSILFTLLPLMTTGMPF